jgi:hypothetical protein
LPPWPGKLCWRLLRMLVRADAQQPVQKRPAHSRHPRLARQKKSALPPLRRSALRPPRRSVQLERRPPTLLLLQRCGQLACAAHSPGSHAVVAAAAGGGA